MYIVVTNRPLRFARFRDGEFAWTTDRNLAVELPKRIAEVAVRCLGDGLLVRVVNVEVPDFEDIYAEVCTL
jgi:hypothetical protein